MSTSHGVIQGYNGVAVVDEKHQIIVNAEAYGEGQEAHLLQPMLESTREGLKAAKIAPDVFQQTKVAADAGYHSGASVAYTQENGIDAFIADRSHRQRDPAFADYDRHKTRFRKDKRRYHEIDSPRFTAKDFIYDEKDRSCRCPAGNQLYRNGTNINDSWVYRDEVPRSQIGVRAVYLKTAVFENARDNRDQAGDDLHWSQ